VDISRESRWQAPVCRSTTQQRHLLRFPYTAICRQKKTSTLERSGFAEPAHIAAETLLATHRRTRCALKRLADRSQPTLLGMLSQRVGSAYLAYAVGLQAPFIQQLLGLKSVDTAYKH